MGDIGYIKAIGIYYKTELRTIHKKSETPLQAIFEAFTNSLESIQASREQNATEEKGFISIELHVVKNLLSSEDNTYNFDKITITDSGIGFNDKEYTRFLNLRDDRKNFKNKGTGRVQYLHTFDKTIFNSIYQDKNSSSGFSERKITLSKAEAFLKQNAIIRLDAENEIDATETETTVTFHTVLEDKDKSVFNYISAQDIKRELIRHYLAGFCEHREELPEIKITKFIEGEIETELTIKSGDIPIPTKEEHIEIRYSKVNGNAIEKTSNNETFDLKAFVIPTNELDKNGLKLISKGEEAKEITLRNLIASDEIDGNRYLFLLSGNYIDERDSDTRGEINIVTAKELKNRDSNSLFAEEEILIEDIEDRTNQTIVSLFKEIQEKRKEKEENIKELQKMFLLNDKTLNALKNKIKIDDSDDVILRKVYEADAKIIATKDAEIKQQIEALEELEPTEKDYQKKLSVKVDEFVKTIPLQNRTALTQYVARRKMVIELFGKILKKEIDKLKDGGRIDENLMHNLIFQQSTDNPEISDLWLIAEDFIYFKGTSESQLGKLQIDGVNIIKETLSEEEEQYRLKQKGDAKQKRTDILLFPKEGKCIIIELKAPETNVSEHLNQINRYASLINNLSKDTYKFDTFYGYLIGENIDVDDIEDNDSDFKSAHSLDFIFRPHKRIAGKFGKSDGSLYTEIIKYSTLLERAELRNKIFIQKLENTK
jgi:hypothetical protein